VSADRVSVAQLARKITCPLCRQRSNELVLPLELGANGLPLACATVPGYGVPVYRGPPYLCVTLDGEQVKEALAYSIPEGWIWAAQLKSDGGLAMRDGSVAMEKRTGAVAVEAIAA
jgi:hypothetical protein